MKLTNPLALENMAPWIGKTPQGSGPDAPITTPLPSEDAPTAGLTTQAIRRDTARMTAEERRERLAETIVTNGLRRQAAFALERDHYRALGIAA